MLTGQAYAAASPPALDTTRLCEAEARRDASANVAECLSAEQRAFDYLRAAYPAVPRKVSDRCERLSRQRTSGFGSYAFIQGCLDLK